MLYDPKLTIPDLQKATLDGKVNLSEMLYEFMQPITLLGDLPFCEATGKEEDLGTFAEGWTYNEASKPTDLDHGVAPTKFKYASRADKIGYREGQFQFTKKHADLGGASFAQLVNNNIAQKTQWIALDSEHDLFYADYRQDPRLYNGLFPRFSVLTDEDGVISAGDHQGEISPYITINAGGTSSGSLSSMFMIVPGPQATCLIYPKGDLTWGFDYDKGNPTDMKDENGNTIRGRTDIFTSRFGLALRNRRACVRVANIDTSSTDSIKKCMDALYVAADALPVEIASRAIIYANKKVLREFKKYFNDKTTPPTYEGAKPQNITGAFEIPGLGFFRRCDHLTVKESTVA